ncbi:unnamed protein product, partial [Mesorhabditis belari]|uniref:Uncharacterized protein n=1 Tax=Mesorhabditis belari TaxID=2138241 RepID=A0AAF3FQY9_9BILA
MKVFFLFLVLLVIFSTFTEAGHRTMRGGRKRGPNRRTQRSTSLPSSEEAAPIQSKHLASASAPVSSASHSAESKSAESPASE